MVYRWLPCRRGAGCSWCRPTYSITPRTSVIAGPPLGSLLAGEHRGVRPARTPTQSGPRPDGSGMVSRPPRRDDRHPWVPVRSVWLGHQRLSGSVDLTGDDRSADKEDKVTYVIGARAWTSRTAPAWTSARWTASTRAHGCSTSTPTSVSTAGRASRYARWRRSTTKTTPGSVGGLHNANVEFFDDLGSPRRRGQARRHRQGPPDDRGAAAAGARRITRNLTGVTTGDPGDGCLISRDRLIPFKATAEAHADGLVDLSVGTPVDPTPAGRPAGAARRGGRARLPDGLGTPQLRRGSSTT